MALLSNHLYHNISASNATKNEEEAQISEYKKHLKSNSTQLRANIFRSDENIFMETERKDKTTSESSKNETLDVACNKFCQEQ